jgi:hypothetical protein
LKTDNHTKTLATVPLSERSNRQNGSFEGSTALIILLKNLTFFLLQKVLYESKKLFFNQKEKTAPPHRLIRPENTISFHWTLVLELKLEGDTACISESS